MTCAECINISISTGSREKIPFCKLLLAKLDQLPINRQRGNLIIFERARAIAVEQGLQEGSCPSADLAHAIQGEVIYTTPSAHREDEITPCPVAIALQYPLWRSTAAYHAIAYSLDGGIPMDTKGIESLIATNVSQGGE